MKERLDELVLKNNLAPDINKARALIMSGKILVDDVCEDKCGMKFDAKKNIRLRATKKTEYVSRGALKLEQAIKEFKINVKNKKCMDIGCSTGGFTDYLLRQGASTVHAVDVGSGQLDWALRNDNRVIVMEKTNIRHVEVNDNLSNFEFICVDVSFISITFILDKIVELMKKGGELVLLIKPQFEAKKDQVDEGGIVSSETVHKEVIDKVRSSCESKGLTLQGLTKSPIYGAKGNTEFLAYYRYE